MANSEEEANAQEERRQRRQEEDKICKYANRLKYKNKEA